VGLYNVNTKASMVVPIPSDSTQSTGTWLVDPVVDTVNHLIFVVNIRPPGSVRNNNATITVNVVDEVSGKLLETIVRGVRGFIGTAPSPALFVNGTRREAWLFDGTSYISVFPY
jgi:hypothetical protein